MIAIFFDSGSWSGIEECRIAIMPDADRDYADSELRELANAPGSADLTSIPEIAEVVDDLEGQEKSNKAVVRENLETELVRKILTTGHGMTIGFYGRLLDAGMIPEDIQNRIEGCGGMFSLEAIDGD